VIWFGLSRAVDEQVVLSVRCGLFVLYRTKMGDAQQDHNNRAKYLVRATTKAAVKSVAMELLVRIRVEPAIYLFTAEVNNDDNDAARDFRDSRVSGALRGMRSSRGPRQTLFWRSLPLSDGNLPCLVLVAHCGSNSTKTDRTSRKR
jgi:hypothetical protein